MHAQSGSKQTLQGQNRELWASGSGCDSRWPGAHTRRLHLCTSAAQPVGSIWKAAQHFAVHCGRVNKTGAKQDYAVDCLPQTLPKKAMQTNTPAAGTLRERCQAHLTQSYFLLNSLMRHWNDSQVIYLEWLNLLRYSTLAMQSEKNSVTQMGHTLPVTYSRLSLAVRLLFQSLSFHVLRWGLTAQP